MSDGSWAPGTTRASPPTSSSCTPDSCKQPEGGTEPSPRWDIDFSSDGSWAPGTTRASPPTWLSEATSPTSAGSAESDGGGQAPLGGVVSPEDPERSWAPGAAGASLSGRVRGLSDGSWAPGTTRASPPTSSSSTPDSCCLGKQPEGGTEPSPRWDIDFCCCDMTSTTRRQKSKRGQKSKVLL